MICTPSFYPSRVKLGKHVHIRSVCMHRTHRGTANRSYIFLFPQLQSSEILHLQLLQKSCFLQLCFIMTASQQTDFLSFLTTEKATILKIYESWVFTIFFFKVWTLKKFKKRLWFMFRTQTAWEQSFSTNKGLFYNIMTSTHQF